MTLRALYQSPSELPADRTLVDQRAKCVKVASDFLAQGIAVAIGTNFLLISMFKCENSLIDCYRQHEWRSRYPGSMDSTFSEFWVANTMRIH